MSNRRNPGDPSAGMPPPPPYEPVASARSNAGRPQQQYAPPPGPPPGHAPISQYQPPSASSYHSNNPFSNPRGVAALPNLMDADSHAYISGSTDAGGVPGTIGSSSVSRQDGVSAHARQLSQEGQTSRPMVSAGAMPRQPSIKENQLELLKAYDSIFVIDDSSSMNVNERPDGTMGQSRWEEARDALAGMVEIAARHDDDGVDVHFLNSEKSLLGCRDPQQVKALFDSIEPEGVTPMGTKLELLLLQYMDDIEAWKAKKTGPEPKKRNYICLTDGSPTDDPESVIVATARRLDRGNFPLAQIGIQFIQVGNDEEARQALEELDDALSHQHQVRDMVDTVPYTNLALSPQGIIKALLGGINRRLDRQRAPA